MAPPENQAFIEKIIATNLDRATTTTKTKTGLHEMTARTGRFYSRAHTRKALYQAAAVGLALAGGHEKFPRASREGGFGPCRLRAALRAALVTHDLGLYYVSGA